MLRIVMLVLFLQLTAFCVSFADAPLQPWNLNPWYWSDGGKPVLLLGGSDDDNPFQWPKDRLIAQLDRLADAGGNVIRNTMSDRKDGGWEVYPFAKRQDGKYDLDQWNAEYWDRFEFFLSETARRQIFVQIEVWDRFDYTDNRTDDPKRWENHPYNPINNDNYTEAETGLGRRYPEHPGANKQPFFFSTPEQRNISKLLHYQEAFVNRLLDYSLKHDHVLYCIDNETKADPEWGEFWTKLIQKRAAAAGKSVPITEMWDDWDLKAKRHRQTFDHPELYSFVDVSQNNHNKDDEHWNNFQYVRQLLGDAPRPINTTKTYGADGNKFGHNDQDAIERFWRHLLAGAASIRFHRPPSGLGLSDKAVACIRAARKLESIIPLWTIDPAQSLLSSRDKNEAYAAAEPGTAYAVYFPSGGEVILDVSDAIGSLKGQWIDIDSGEIGPTGEYQGGGTIKLSPPDKGNWAVAIVKADSADRPNIVLILADDLGYGDLQCYNVESQIPTPNLNRLASQGMRFVDAHSPCTVCTPTRYSLMTGQMAFRVPRGGTVFTGAGGPSLIAPGRLTLPEMLRRIGYSTACFGKWHVGMTFYDNQGRPIDKGGLDAVKRIDFTRPITGGPIDHGFEQFFGTACCPTTDWLYAYIDGNRIPVPSVNQLDRSTLPDHPYSKDNRPGMLAPDFDLEEVDMKFLQKSQAFLRKHINETPDKPFFLFHSTQAVHLPSFPGGRFKGKTESGPHGDFIFELDYVVGELMQELEQLGIADKTLVLFSSDNGPEVPTVYHMRHDHDHDGARPWRGVKRDNWEGGHRVPMLVRWPGKITPGTTSDQITSLTDVMATVADIVGVELPHSSAEDSFSMLPALLGEDDGRPIRPYVLQQGFGGAKYLAIRRGNWKYLAHKGSGGNRYESHPMLSEYLISDTAPDAPGQLYDLATDPGETTNLYHEHPNIVAELESLLKATIASGRSADR